MSTTPTSDFSFKNDDQHDYSKFEYVNILKRTPKNPKDYHDLENILRYRMITMIKELYGDCRTAPAGKSPFSLQGNKIKTSGVWYFNGYRLFLDNVLSENEIVSGGNYAIFIKVDFAEKDFNSYPSIALQDPQLKSPVQTSTRIVFDYKVMAVSYDLNTLPPAPDADYYHFGYALWNAATKTWDFKDSEAFTVIDMKYQNAMNVVQTAVHTEGDGRTVAANRMVTDPETGRAKVFFEEVSENKISVGFLTEQGNNIAAFEMVNENDEWNPILWMQPGKTEYPMVYVTPDGFNIFDNKGYVGKYAHNQLSVGNDVNNFSVDNDELRFLTGAKNAFRVKRYVPSSKRYLVVPTITGEQTTMNDGLYNPAVVVKSDGPTPAKSAQYDFAIPWSQAPTDRVVTFNHKIVLQAGLEGLISAKVEVKSPGAGGFYELVARQRWIIKPGNAVLNLPFVFTVNTAQPPAIGDWSVRVTYNAEALHENDEVKVFIGLKSGENGFYDQYSEMYPVTELSTLSMSGYVLAVDSNGALRIKKITDPSNPSQNIKDMLGSAAGTTVTAQGGMIIGDTSAIRGFHNSQVFADIIGEVDLEEPSYIEGTGLVFPMAAKDHVKAGLISHDQYTFLYNQVSKDPVPQGIPEKVAYVSTKWSGFDPNKALPKPFFTSITDAVAYIAGLGGGTVQVYPGTYGGTISINADKPGVNIKIFATDPVNTKVIGKVICSTKTDSYFDIPLEPASDFAVNCSGKDTKIHFGKNCSITSSKGTTAISLHDGTYVFDGPVTHTGAIADQNTPAIGVSAGSDIVSDVTFNGDILVTQAKKAIQFEAGNLTINGNFTAQAAYSSNTLALINVYSHKNPKLVVNGIVTAYNAPILYGTNNDFVDNGQAGNATYAMFTNTINSSYQPTDPKWCIMSLTNGSITLQGCSFYGNHTTGHVFQLSTTIYIYNCYVSNYAPIFYVPAAGGSSVYLKNSVFTPVNYVFTNDYAGSVFGSFQACTSNKPLAANPERILNDMKIQIMRDATYVAGEITQAIYVDANFITP